jgi:hypothetical protein
MSWPLPASLAWPCSGRQVEQTTQRSFQTRLPRFMRKQQKMLQAEQATSCLTALTTSMFLAN